MKISNEQKELARQALQAIADRNGGQITPEQVIQAAKDPDSPLHSFFTWDVDAAAHAHWLTQARSLIRSVKIKIRTETKTVTAVGFVRDPSKEASEAGYVSVRSIRNDEDRKRDAMIAEFKRIASAIERARSLAAYFGMETDVDEFLVQVNGLRAQFEAHHATQGTA